MSPTTAAERKRAERQRRRDEGWMAFEIWVSLEDWPRVKRYIDRVNKKRRAIQDNQTGGK